MNIVFIIFSIFIFFWILGVATAWYHVHKYRIPGDVTLNGFWAFVGVSAIILLVVIYFMSGINWGSI